MYNVIILLYITNHLLDLILIIILITFKSICKSYSEIIIIINFLNTVLL